MSRIGKKRIVVPKSVKVAIANGEVKVEGPKGKLSVTIPSADIKVELKGGELLVVRPSDSRQHRAQHGLARAILANAAKGVATGWGRALANRGVGRTRRAHRTLALA